MHSVACCVHVAPCCSHRAASRPSSSSSPIPTSRACSPISECRGSAVPNCSRASRGHEINAATEQLMKMSSELDALMLRDPLTGLYSHRAFQERLGEEIARALRYGQPMSLLIADIDGFASVNYDLGYQIGDEI